MNNPLLLLFTVVNVAVTALFEGVVLSQFLRRHRTYQLYWSIALTMAFLATLSYVLMILVQATSSAGMVFFRTYYILGAALMPAWLGLGSIALVASKLAIRISLLILCLLSLLAAFLISLAPIDSTKLGHIAGTPGTGILQPGFWLVTIIVLNTLGVLAVVGVAIYSGWKLLQRHSNVAGFPTYNLLWANILILLGDLLNAAAGTLARFLGLQSSFWLIMTAGWIVFFCGVLLTSRRGKKIKPAEQREDAQKSAASI